jgi:hypothetical protein
MVLLLIVLTLLLLISLFQILFGECISFGLSLLAHLKQLGVEVKCFIAVHEGF